MLISGCVVKNVFPSAKASSQRKAKHWLEYIGLSLLVSLSLLLGALWIFGFFYVVPPISAKVVDAISGKPIPRMNVCLQFESMNLGGLGARGITVSTTNRWGRVFFWPSIHAAVLPSWRGYWIRVTDPDAQIVPPCGAYVGWMELGAKGWPINLEPEENSSRRYFPVALVRDEMNPNFRGWSALHRALDSAVGSRIALIPVLQNVSDCRQISDAQLEEDCRQLNTYAAAMSLRKKDDIENWTVAETLCDAVDHSFASAQCKGVFRRVTRSRQNRRSNPSYNPNNDPFDE
jgi:hypothetical protein